MSAPVASDRRIPLSEFEEYIESISAEVLAYFARRVHNRDDAADCLSETLLILWRRRDNIPSAFDDKRAWTFGVAHGVLQNYQRSGIRRLALADRLRDQLLTQPATEEPEGNDALTRALASLKDADRELVTLIAWEGLNLIQAAAILNINHAAARTRYSRARLRLRRALGN
ncbi:MAG TPA: sigma-70 family RNA polymerase sigma factor [Glaciihabitans sp.]|jgi:RNA polymerase sigma-70 factor (ECF subfamily)|nr:sigma-70 family RNA polymerase sigma factor [Glaciihabitans sp.]